MFFELSKGVVLINFLDVAILINLFCFLITDHVISSTELFLYSSKNYSFIHTPLFWENLKVRILESMVT